MSIAQNDLMRMLGSGAFWRAAIRLTFAVAVGLTILALVITTFFILIPVALLGGLALHLYLRRRLQRATRDPYRHPPRDRGSVQVIEGEYTVVERR